jgi:hypothetical protein
MKHYGKNTSAKELDVLGVNIKLKLKKKEVGKYYENWYLEIEDHVEEKDAENWIETKLAG